MRYKISDIAKVLGVTTDALRYYEKENIVRPWKDKFTNYRYYDFWDVNFLIDALWYRSFGFSVKDVSGMISEDTLEELDRRFESMEQTYEHELLRTGMLLSLAKARREKWKKVPEMLGKCELVMRPAHVHFEYRFDESFTNNPDITKLSREWLEYMPLAGRYFETAAGDISLKDSEDYSWGLSLPIEYAQTLGVKIAPPLRYEGRCKSIHSYFKSSGKGGFSSGHISFMLDFAKEHSLKICGNASGTLLTSVIYEGVPTGLFEAWLPVENSPSTPEEDIEVYGKFPDV